MVPDFSDGGIVGLIWGLATAVAFWWYIGLPFIWEYIKEFYGYIKDQIK